VSGFSITPALPAGLALDSTSGIISGLASVASPNTTYTVTATFAGYPASSTSLSLQVLEYSTTLDITEFMASNSTTLLDGDNNYSDWIEINNYGSVPIDLFG
jgi:hypothetical protein